MLNLFLLNINLSCIDILNRKYFEIGKNNLKTELCLIRGRILAEEQQIKRSRGVRSANSIENIFKIWLESIEGEFFDELDKLTKNFTAKNAQDFLDWMHKKGGIITKTLNLSPGPDEKSFLNNTLASWEKLTEETLLNSIKDSLLHRMLSPENVTTNNNGSSITSASSNPTSSNSTSSPTPTQLYGLTTSSIYTSSVESTVSPTTALPSSSDLSPTTSSGSHINSTTSSTNDTSDLPTVLPTSGMNNSTTIMNNSTALIPPQHGGGLTSTACVGLYCAPAFAALPVSLALLGGVLVFVLLYKYTPVGKFLGRDNPKKKKAKKRLNEIPMERINSPKLLKEEKTENVKRSRLDSFLRAFGYNKKFPYIDEDVTSDQLI
ncbi:PIR-like protein [Plasmodium gallinaceum]|uniref:PIR-like protein n=1 Tax=Plasmodium gallinaceum TaxID=5849 RepID=A0A1J1GSG4_PLAGA|nr:PIR-like protein [Plasmodium gallinaceum]CRG95459.1 PIR-like protein [Plasmodium gallinaceum]